MIRATIYRSHELANNWHVIVTDTVRDTRSVSQHETVTEAATAARAAGATKVTVSMGEGAVSI